LEISPSFAFIPREVINMLKSTALRQLGLVGLWMAAALGTEDSRAECSRISDSAAAELAALSSAVDASAPRDQLVDRLNDLERAIRNARSCATLGEVTVPTPGRAPFSNNSASRPSPGEMMERLDRTHRRVQTPEHGVGLDRVEQALRDVQLEVQKPILDYRSLKSILRPFRSNE
jgi:hypothetical protein